MAGRDNFNPQVGDMVRFRQWEDMENEFGLEGFGHIRTCVPFTKEMRYLCGTKFIVKRIDGDRVFGSVGRWYITKDMLEPAEDEPEEDYDTEAICAFLRGVKVT